MDITKERHAQLGLFVLKLFPTMMQFILKYSIAPARLNREYLLKTLQKVFTEDEIDLLKTLPKVDNFTINICYKILRFGSLIEEPQCKWGNIPLEKDIKIEDDIQRIINYSNDVISRTSGEIDEIYSNVFEENVKQMITRVDVYLKSDDCQNLYQNLHKLQIDLSEVLRQITGIKTIKVNSSRLENDVNTTMIEFCLRISIVIIDVFPDIYRNIIESKISAKQLTMKLTNSLSDIKFFPNQKPYLDEFLGSNSYSSLDIPIIYKLLRHFNMFNLNLSEPSMGWGENPGPNDTSIADDVERIRFFRNEIAHRRDTKMDQNEFEDCFERFREIGKRADAYFTGKTNYEQKVVECKTCSIDVQMQRKYENAVKELENLKLRFESKPVRFYWGDTFEGSLMNLRLLIRDQIIDGNDKCRVQIVLQTESDINDTTVSILNSIKDEINQGLKGIEFIVAVKGSIILYVDILAEKLETNDKLQSLLLSFIKTIVGIIDVSPTENVEAVLILSGENTCFEMAKKETNTTSVIKIDFNVDAGHFTTDDKMKTALKAIVENIEHKSKGGGIKGDITATVMSIDYRLKAVLSKEEERESTKMDEIAKIDKAIASYCKGMDKKNDALMLMSPECSWDQFLTPAPFAIALLGELVLISTDTDFSLEEKPPTKGFKHLRYPNSFRASLIQISNAGWSAFNEAHISMDKIFLHNGNVDGHVKNGVSFLLQGTPNEVEEMLPMSLTKIQYIADESQHLAKATEERFVGVIELTGELLEACINTKGVYDEKSCETEIAINVAKSQREHREKELKETERRLKNMEREVKDAQSDFKDAIHKIPTASSLLKLAAGEALVDMIRGITSLPGMLGVFKEVGSYERDKAYYDWELSLQRVYVQVSVIVENVESIVKIVAGEIDDHGNGCSYLTSVLNGNLDFLRTSFENCRTNIKGEVKSGKPVTRAVKICNEGIVICNDLKAAARGVHSQNQQNLVKRAHKLQQEARALNVEARKAQRKNPLDNKSPFCSKMPTESSSPSFIKAATENARFKTEMAKETLKDAKRRQEKSADQLSESNKKLTQIMKEMAQFDNKHVDFNKIRDILVKGIKAFAQVKEQWVKMVLFFQMLSKLIKCCLHTSLQDFVDQAKMGRELKIGDSSTLLFNIFRDVLIEQASKASQIAYVVREISGTYVQISNENLMDKITCLGCLVTLDPKKDEHEILIRRRELHSDCSKAQKSIQSIILKKKAEFNQNLEERMRKIRELEAKLPPIEPKREEEIKKSVSDGMKTFTSVDMDELIYVRSST